MDQLHDKLILSTGESTHYLLQDMDLSNKNRTLIHNGMLLRPPDNGFWWNDWIELFVLLFDNYCLLYSVLGPLWLLLYL